MKFDLPKIGGNINPSDPFEFKCDKCEKTHIFTEDEIEKVKIKIPDTSNDYHIICQFCKKGIGSLLFLCRAHDFLNRFAGNLGFFSIWNYGNS